MSHSQRIQQRKKQAKRSRHKALISAREQVAREAYEAERLRSGLPPDVFVMKKLLGHNF